MIGQARLISEIKDFVASGVYPRFSIFIGESGSGKKALGKELSKMLKCNFIVWGNTVEDIRNLVEFMWEQKETIVYCIPNYEEMSQGARNAILKICEEPPNNAYIILTSTSKDIVLPTLLNRGQVFEMQDYTEDELHCIEKDNFGFDVGHSREDVDKMVKLCRVPGDLDKVRNIDVEDFMEFVKLFWNNISKASAGNALKVVSKLRIKEDSDTNLYDINIFLNYISKLNESLEDIHKRVKVFREILEARKNIQLKYNKQYIVDNFILKIRGILNGDI